MATCSCCGCVLVSDYGTSTVTGTGSQTDPYVITHVDPNFVRPMVRISGGAIAPTTTAVTASLPFTTEVFDTDTMWAVGQPTRIIFQKRGLFLIGAFALWVGNVTGYREMSILYTPSVGVPSTLETTRDDDPPATDLYQKINYQWFFEVGDYIEIQVTQTSGGGLNVGSGVAWAMYTGRKV